ncbi:MAG: SpoIID/LytB domain-containing protein, partial [Oscillospiraceae bacterium]|nr:SpoIID/LytB domain-containing protein [Oscillospiraceae bacterium]
MVVAKEMTYTWNPEALKAQAVATHTYLRYQYASGNSAPAVSGRTTPYASVTAAVNEVADKIMTINGKAVYTPYFASSAGRTNSSAEVWGGHYSHLVSVESEYDHLANGYEGKVKISLEDMEKIIEKIGIEPEGDPEDWFEILNYTSGGYVNEMKICGEKKYNGKTITGRRMREDILKGKGMRSAAFEIDYDADDEEFTFTTYGYGHGAGMSQWGAQLYALNEGWSYKQILTHYYTGVTIQSIK